MLISFSFASQLQTLIDFAFKNNPRIESFERLKEGLRHRSKFSTALPNPQVFFALNNVDTENYFPTDKNPMSGFALSITQKYPLGVKRKKSSEIFLEKVKEVDSAKVKFLKDLEKELKILYWDYIFSFEKERIVKRIEVEVRGLLQIVEERYRFGKALLSDLILLKAELLKVEEKLHEAQLIRRSTLERIWGLAGGRIDLKEEPLVLVDIPENFVPENNPTVRILNAQLQVIKKEIERSKVEHLPDLFLSAGYTVRPDIPNLITLRIGATIPVWKKKREDLLVMEKQEFYKAKMLEIEEAKLRIEGQFKALKEAYSKKLEILKTIEEEIKEKEKEIEALLLAYEYDMVDVRDILRAYRVLWDLRLKKAQVIRDANKLVAQAEALI